MDIPPDTLPAATLDALIEEFITREGTFVGDGEAPDLSADIARVRRQIIAGAIRISFDPDTETTSLVPAED